MSVQRVVPDLASRSLEEGKRFYRHILGFEPVMDHGWIVTLAHPHQPGSQISLMTKDASAPVTPNLSVHVDDVEGAYAAAIEQGPRSCIRLRTNPGACVVSSSATPTVM